MAETFFARLSLDGTTVSVMRGGWKHRFPVADLPRWITLYRSLRDRKGGGGSSPTIAVVYASAVEALERIAGQVRQGVAHG